MKTVLFNKSKNCRDRYYLLHGSMGGAGEPANHANNHFEVVNGVDLGDGYQGYMSVSYALSYEYLPKVVKAALRACLSRMGYNLDTLLRP